MCALRDAAPDFDKLKVKVFGISYDDVQSQAAFHKAQKLNFPLLSDPDGSVAGKYGADRGGRPFARRYTIIIDDKGVLRHVDKKVSVRTHGADVVALVEKLRGE